MMKRWICMCLALLLTLSVLSGCGGQGQTPPDQTSGGQSQGGETGGEVGKVTFPLAEPVEFTFMLEGIEGVTFRDDISNNKFWKELEEKTNVHINFMFLGDPGSQKLALLVSGGSYGDVLWGGPVINSAEASKYIASGKFTDLTPYITPELMPNLSHMIDNRPDMKKMLSAADGKIYTLPRVTELEGWYLESPLFVNKKWLDNLHLEIPTTLDEFTEMLRAFSEDDPNGNGLADEIPFICASCHDYMNVEALLGIWGVPTKDATNDSFVRLKDGKVQFVPTTDEYKQYLKYMAMLYKEGLMWNELFTANTTTLNAKLTAPTCVVGSFTSRTPPTTEYMDDYVCILPPKAEGYEPCWYYNPAINGSKNQFFVMDTCQNVDVLMAWVDELYALDASIRLEYGEPEEGRYTVEADGSYTIVDLDTVTAEKVRREHPTVMNLMNNSLRAFTAEGYEHINLSKSERIMQNNYEIYKDIISKELWPRPYIPAQEAFDADTYTVDIFYQVTTYRANCITGVTDVDSTWDSYVQTIESLGLDAYLTILQNSYDVAWANG